MLEGEIGALLGDDVAVAGPGSYVWKPRNEWHTFWNAGDAELRFIELLLPGGFEGYFELLATRIASADDADPAEIHATAARYGLEVDGSTVAGLCERFGLTFGWRVGARRRSRRYPWAGRPWADRPCFAAGPTTFLRVLRRGG